MLGTLQWGDGHYLCTWGLMSTTNSNCVWLHHNITLRSRTISVCCESPVCHTPYHCLNYSYTTATSFSPILLSFVAHIFILLCDITLLLLSSIFLSLCCHVDLIYCGLTLSSCGLWLEAAEQREKERKKAEEEKTLRKIQKFLEKEREKKSRKGTKKGKKWVMGNQCVL